MIQTGTQLVNSIPWGPGNEDNGSYNIIFSPISSSTTSHTIQVDENPFIVQAWGLVSSEEVQVWSVGGLGAGQYFSQIYMNGSAVKLTATDNKFVIDVAGRYQFRLANGGLGTVYVAGFDSSNVAAAAGFGKYVP